MKPPRTPTARALVQPPGPVAQRSVAEAVFAPLNHRQRPGPTLRTLPEELVPGPGGRFMLRSTDRHTLAPPSGTFNFVRVHGLAPRERPMLVSSRLAHAQLAAGRPVVYAGAARFERGEMAWWSNYSGTYQPIAAFRAQAGLPEDKFVPWQKLQMNGVAMQRGTFTERRAVTVDRAKGRGTAEGSTVGRTPSSGRAVASDTAPDKAVAGKRKP
jgi:hypothetical protein